MAKRTDIKKILVIGSGPIVIGQAAEFDYAGTQACLALKEEGYEFREGPAFLPYWEHGVEYVTILGPNQEIVEFIQKFASEEEKEKAVKALG